MELLQTKDLHCDVLVPVTEHVNQIIDQLADQCGVSIRLHLIGQIDNPPSTAIVHNAKPFSIPAKLRLALRLQFACLIAQPTLTDRYALANFILNKTGTAATREIWVDRLRFASIADAIHDYDGPDLIIEHEPQLDLSVAVIITCHNYANYLDDAISSLLNQTVLPAEMIVVDDAGEDDVLSVLSKYDNVQYLRTEFQNVARAREAGLANTTAPIVMFLDADDYLSCDYIEYGLRRFTDQVGIVYADLQEIEHGSTIIKSMMFDERTLDTFNFINAAALVRREALEQIGPLPQLAPVDFFEDWYVWTEIVKLGWKGVYVPNHKLPSKPLKIGVISYWFPSGGIESLLLTLFKYTNKTEIDYCGIHVPMLGLAHRVERFAVSQLDGLIELCSLEELKARSDVIVVHNVKVDLGDYLGKVVIVGHGSGDSAKRFAASQSYNGTQFVAVSESARNAFPDAIRERVTIIHNGIDLDRLRPVGTNIRDEFNLGSRPVIGYIGRYELNKNLDKLVDALEWLPDDWQVILVGDDGQWDSEAIRRLYKPRVHLIPLRYDIADILLACDCVALVSTAEGFSISLLEAWGLGIPTVCTRVGAIDELERLYGDMCVSIPTSSPIRIAAAIIEAKRRKQRLAEKTVPLIARQFSGQAVARRWVDYLSKLL